MLDFTCPKCGDTAVHCETEEGEARPVHILCWFYIDDAAWDCGGCGHRWKPSECINLNNTQRLNTLELDTQE